MGYRGINGPIQVTPTGPSQPRNKSTSISSPPPSSEVPAEGGGPHPLPRRTVLAVSRRHPRQERWRAVLAERCAVAVPRRVSCRHRPGSCRLASFELAERRAVAVPRRASCRFRPGSCRPASFEVDLGKLRRGREASIVSVKEELVSPNG